MTSHGQHEAVAYIYRPYRVNDEISGPVPFRLRALLSVDCSGGEIGGNVEGEGERVVEGTEG